MDKPSHVYASTDSLWAFYCYVTLALQSSHPKTWLEEQRILHYFISTVGNFTPVPVAPIVEEVIDELENNYGQPENQTNLLVQIAETTGDETVLLPQGISADVYHGMNELMEADAKMLMFGDDSGYKYIQEVHDKAAQDQIIYGVSGIKVDENGSHYIPVEEVLQKMEEESSIKGNEPPTLPVEPADYDFNAPYKAISIETAVEEYGHHIPNTQAVQEDEEIVYTDAVGNTFKVPVPPCVGHDFELEETFDLIDKYEEEEDENIPDFF
jgi:hypothetical protein